MKHINLNFIGAALVLAVLSTSSLHAQTFPYTWSNSSVDFEMRADGTFIDKGTTTALGLSGTDVGAGTRMLWYPSLSAFRAGSVTGNYWDLGNIGQYSFAAGQNTEAAGYGSTCLGVSNWSGQYSVSMGQNNSANNWCLSLGLGNSCQWYSIAMGTNCSSNAQYSVAIGNSCVSTNFSQAIGNGANATAGWSTALGENANATGNDAVAIGWSTSTGYASLATGSTWATGDYSASFDRAYSNSYCGLALGYNNVALGSNGATPSGTTWVATDPLLELGNGISGTASDALVVYKNGNAKFQGTVTITPTSDIPTYTGN